MLISTITSNISFIQLSLMHRITEKICKERWQHWCTKKPCVKVLPTLLISTITSNMSFIQLSLMLSGYPASSFILGINFFLWFQLEVETFQVGVGCPCRGGGPKKKKQLEGGWGCFSFGVQYSILKSLISTCVLSYVDSREDWLLDRICES